MSKFKLTITDDAGAEKSKEFTLPADALPRIITAYRQTYPTIQTGVDDKGVPILTATTDDQVLGLAAWGLVKGILANVESYEREQARLAVVVAPLKASA